MAGSFKINFINFGLFVHHKGGLTAILGSQGHSLSIAVDDGPAGPVTAFTEFHLKAPGASGPRATAPSGGGFMPDLAWIYGQHVEIAQDRVTGGTVNNQNARVQLWGGQLVDRPSANLQGEPQIAELLWDFSDIGTVQGPRFHRMTNRVTFEGTIEDGVDYALEWSTRDAGPQRITIEAGTQITFTNADKEPCPKVDGTLPVVTDRQVADLLTAVDLDLGIGAPKATVGAVVAEAGGELCQPCGHIRCHQYW